jgi:hypothetical protein
MKVPLLSSHAARLRSLFPLPFSPQPEHNFYTLYDSQIRFSVVRPVDKVLLHNRRQVIKHFMSHEYYEDEFLEISRNYRVSQLTDEAVTEDLLRGDLPNHLVPKDDHYWYAIQSVRDAFAPDHLVKPVHFADLRLYPWEKSTNVEAPYAFNKTHQDWKRSMYSLGLIPTLRNSFSNFVDLVFLDTRRQIHHIKNGDAQFNKHIKDTNPYFYYFTTHAKSSVVKESDPDKIRMIFGAPKLFVLAEAMFFWPLFASYMSEKTVCPMLWNYAILNGGWLRLNQEFQFKYKQATCLMLDWKQFDKRALYDVFDDIEDCWMSYFDFDNGYQPTFFVPKSFASSKRLRNLWFWTCHARRHIPVLLPDGRVLFRSYRGVPSGLFTTQYLDSFYNAVMIVTILSRLGIYININTMLKLMGDDSITLLPLFIPIAEHDNFMLKFSELALEYFDAIVNIKKSKMSERLEGAEVLSYANHNGLPSRDEFELAARFLWTKNLRPTPSQTMAQAVGIAYATADPSMRLYTVCKNVYSYYADQGYTPDQPHVHDAFYLSDLREFPSSFPSPDEIMNRLFSHSRRSKIVEAKYWPRWFFTSDP